MDVAELVDVICTEIFPDLRLTKKQDRVMCNGRALTVARLQKEIYSKEFWEVHRVDEFMLESDDLKKRKLSTAVLAAIKDKLLKEYEEGSALPVSEDEDLQLTPIYDLNSEKKRLYDEQQGTMSYFNFKNWKEALLYKYGKTVQDSYMKKMKRCYIIFDPNSPKGIFQDKNPFNPSLIANFANLYAPPLWRQLEMSPEECEELEPDVEKFLAHLFSTEDSRRYAMKWIRNVLTLRNETALIMQGVKGNGKSTLCLMVRALVGNRYYQVASKGFLTSQFDGQQEGKLIMMLDEQDMTEKGKESIKAYLNKYGSVEAKGVDVSDPIKLTANFILCGNDPKQFFIEEDDRRFSIPDLTKTPLLKNKRTPEGLMLEKDIRAMVDRFETDIETQRKFGWHILHHCDYPEFDHIVPHKETETFKELVKATLTDWQKQFIHLMYENEKMMFREFRASIDVRVGRPKLQRFILEQQRLNKVTYAKIYWEKDVKDYVIASNIHPNCHAELTEHERQNLDKIKYLLDGIKPIVIEDSVL